MILHGYGALFNVETVIAGLFRERIAPGAFAETIAHDDIRALFNHDPNNVLARTRPRTLTLQEDAKGLQYTIHLNEDDPQATSISAKIARGDVSGSSFWFAIDRPDDEEWTDNDPKKLPLRTLKRLRLIDVGPVAFPAYVDTTVAARHAPGLERVRLLRQRLRIERARAI